MEAVSQCVEAGSCGTIGLPAPKFVRHAMWGGALGGVGRAFKDRAGRATRLVMPTMQWFGFAVGQGSPPAPTLNAYKRDYGIPCQTPAGPTTPHTSTVYLALTAQYLWPVPRARRTVLRSYTSAAPWPSLPLLPPFPGRRPTCSAAARSLSACMMPVKVAATSVKLAMPPPISSARPRPSACAVAQSSTVRAYW